MATVSWFPMLVMLLGLGGAIPLGVPPAEEDPVMAAVAPEHCLAYVSWAATEKPDAHSSNQTEQLLAEPEVQKLFAEIVRAATEGLKKAAEKQPRAAAMVVEDLSRWVPKLLGKSGAIFVSEVTLPPAQPDMRAGMVIGLGDDADALEKLLVAYQQQFLPQAVKEVEIAGNRGYRIQVDPKIPPIFWGVREGYLGIGVGDGVLEGMLERGASEPPAWLQQIRERLPIERRATLSYINITALKELALKAAANSKVESAIKAVGLNNVTALASTTGLGEKEFVTKVLVVTDGKPEGLLGLLPDEPLTAKDMAPIPRDALVAAAARFDVAQVYDTLLGIVETLDPRAHKKMLDDVQRMERETGVELRAGLLEPLGDVWRIYLSPSQGGLLPTGAALVVDVDNPERLKESIRKLTDTVQRAGDERNGPRIEKMKFKGEEIEYLEIPKRGVAVTPAWCIAEKRLIVGLFPQTVKAYLSAKKKGKSLAAVPEVSQMLEGSEAPEKFLYVDTKQVFQFIYPLVPIWAQLANGELHRQGIDFNMAAIPSAEAISKHLSPAIVSVRRTENGIEMTSRQTLPGGNIVASAPISVALLLPAVQGAREAARRSQSMNNLKQIAIAMHNYLDMHKRFPAQYSVDKEGKPLLSWRVHILPLLGEERLYRLFNLDEPWDSPNNKKLIDRMPAVYRDPSSTAGPGRTDYLGISGSGRFFDGKEGTKIQDITDGTANTIMAVGANDASAVIWTKPEDYTPNADDPSAGLFGLHPGGFEALFCDGSVRMIPQGTAKSKLNAMFSISGREPVEMR